MVVIPSGARDLGFLVLKPGFLALLGITILGVAIDEMSSRN
jgi:hypothetical protein